MSQLLTMYIRN